jgi:hypothetical protein
MMTISIASSPAIPLANLQQIAAFVTPSLFCLTSSSDGSVTANEAFGTAFKPRNVDQYAGSVTSPVFSDAANGLQNLLGGLYNSESGFVTNAAGLNRDGTANGSVGLADSGTEIAFQFTGPSNGSLIPVPNVIYLYPAGTAVTASTGAAGASGVALLSGAAFAPGTTTQLPVSNGSATATYEVLLSNPFMLEFAFLPSPGQSVTSRASFAPTSATPVTTYTYHGNPYNTCGGTYCTGGPYALSVQFTTTLTASALASLPFTDITSSVTSFGLTDGSGLVIDNNNAFAKSFSISTDASGNIIAWLIETCGSSCNIQMQTNWNSPTSFNPGRDFSETAPNFAGSYGFVSNHPGTWSMSQAPSAGPFSPPVPRFLGSSGCPIPIPSSAISITASGLLYSRVTQTFNGTVTLTNISNSTISGPFALVFNGLTFGVSVANATGTSAVFGPYITLTGSILSLGQSITAEVRFAAPLGTRISFTPVIYSGSF